MTVADNYLLAVLNRHQTPSSLPIAQSTISNLYGSINLWANGHLYGVYPAGSIAKGTAISGLSDVDILISINPTARESLKDVYETLFNRLTIDGYIPRRQNVSLGLSLNGFKVDIVPAKKQSFLSNEHSLWSHKTQAWRTTNIYQHIQYVRNSNRLNEIKLLKIWKKLHSLEFSSFPMEVMVINALNGRGYLTIAENFVCVLTYIRDVLPSARILDPTKPSNILTDELSTRDKNALSVAAKKSLNTIWNQVVW